MSRRLPVLPIALAGLVCAFTPALAAPPNRPVDFPFGSPVTCAIPVVRSFGDKAVAVWMEIQSTSSTDQRVHFAVSTDSGSTFNDIGNLPPPTNWRWRADPQLAVDPVSGAFFAAGQVSSLTPSGHFGIAVIKGTFSGPSLVWAAPVLVRDVSPGTIKLGSLALAAGSPGGSLHLLFSNYLGSGGGPGTIEYQRSVDGNGAVWSAPVVLSSAPDVGQVSFPHLAAGIGNTLHASWIGAPGFNAQPIRYRASVDLGLNWLAEETAATMRVNPALPGQLQILTSFTQPFDYSMAVNRAPGSFTRGRVGLAWAESWNYADEPFPPVASTVIHDEVEPNDTAPTATPFTPGETLRGTVASSSDLDAWKMTLAAGDAVLFWPDSADVAGAPKLSIMDTNGTSFLENGFFGISNNVIPFRAPAAGTYYVFVPPYAGAWGNTSYRVRTRYGTPGAGEARDMRDVAVAYTDGGGWHAVSHPVFGAQGYDDFMPTIGFGADGLDYVTWYDMLRGGGVGVHAHLVVARNLIGFDPVPSGSVTVTDQVSDWDMVVYYISLGIGTSNDAWGDDRRIQLAWVDGRNGAWDIYATSLSTDAFVTACPHDTTIAAGTTVNLPLGILNRNELFAENMRVFPAGARAWPPGAPVPLAIPSAANQVSAVPVAVPDTAAAGVYPIKLRVYRQSGIVLDSCTVNLTITSAVGVGDVAQAGFGLDPISPSPTVGPCRIGFRLPSSAPVSVAVYGLRGNLVRTVAAGDRPAGPQALTWDGRDDAGRRVAPGLYFVRVVVPGHEAVRRVMVVQ